MNKSSNPYCLQNNQKYNNNLLQILNQIEETINKKQLIPSLGGEVTCPIAPFCDAVSCAKDAHRISSCSALRQRRTPCPFLPLRGTARRGKKEQEGARQERARKGVTHVLCQSTPFTEGVLPLRGTAGSFATKIGTTPCQSTMGKVDWHLKKRKETRQGQSNILLSVSGGQDSIFSLFCLSFLQRQINFNFKLIWCNHFWQKDSFYTTLHLTKSAHAFSLPIIGFIPLHVNSSLSFFQLGFLRKKNCRITKKLKFLKTKRFSNKSLISKRFKSPKFLYKTFNCLQIIPTILKRTQSILPFRKRKKRSCVCNKFFYKSQLFRKEKKFTKILSEATARNWRHITIERSCTFYNSNRCVHGHTLSDRVETILFNLIRGSGNKGATSLTWKRRHSSFCYNKFYPCLEQFKETTHINNC